MYPKRLLGAAVGAMALVIWAMPAGAAPTFGPAANIAATADSPITQDAHWRRHHRHYYGYYPYYYPRYSYYYTYPSYDYYRYPRYGFYYYAPRYRHHHRYYRYW